MTKINPTEETMSSKIIPVDLSLFSEAYNQHVFQLIDNPPTTAFALNINPVDNSVELVGDETTTIVDAVDPNCINAMIGYYTLPALMRNALPYHSWEFIETVSMQLGFAFGCGSLILVADITAEMYETEMEHTPFSGFRVDYVTRWKENGVACLTDVMSKDAIWPGEPTANRLPAVFPILVVGKYMAFHQAVTVPHNVTRPTLNTNMSPQVCGAVIYRSLGTAMVNQKGQHADVTLGGKQYRADVMGCVEV